MNSIIQDSINQLTKKIEAEKQRLLILRLKEKANVTITHPTFFTEESKRRFPRIKIESDGHNAEHIFWNDGSETGVHLISFYYDRDNLTDTDTGIKFSMGFRYL